MFACARHGYYDVTEAAPSGCPACEVDAATRVPAATTHVEHVLEEAIRDFTNGRRNEGVANLAHAVHVALTKREVVDKDRSTQLFRRVTDAAGAWEFDG